MVFNRENTNTIMEFTVFEGHWIPRKDQEMFCLFGVLCGFVSLMIDLKDLRSASIRTTPNPSPWLNENYMSQVPSAIHLIPLVCLDWKMNSNEFSLKYDNPR